MGELTSKIHSVIMRKCVFTHGVINIRERTIDNKANIEIYKKDTESGTLFIMRNTDDELVNGYTYSMYVNGEDIEHLNKAFNCSAELLIGNGGIDVYELDVQPEEIRANLEISNDVPLNFTLRIMGIRGQDPIDVPVMTIQ